VRPAVPGDLHAVAACHLRCWHETYAPALPPRALDGETVAAREAMWRGVLGRHPAWVAVAGADVVGFSGTGPADADLPGSVQLATCYLLAAHHGSGLGQRLLDAAVGSAPAHLWVAEHNPRARAFYRRNGFQPDGARDVLTTWRLPIVRMVRPAVSPAGGSRPRR
jgi:GNAT superfamily N-acetyltransferase